MAVDFENSQTRRTSSSFAGESQAYQQVQLLCFPGCKDGYQQISNIFTETAWREVHAKLGSSISTVARFKAGNAQGRSCWRIIVDPPCAWLRWALRRRAQIAAKFRLVGNIEDSRELSSFLSALSPSEVFVSARVSRFGSASSAVTCTLAHLHQRSAQSAVTHRHTSRQSLNY